MKGDSVMDRLLLALVVIFGVPAATVLYAYLIELFLNRLPTRWSQRLRPWFWLAPALALLTFFLVYPAIQTLRLSLYNANTTIFVGLENYRFAFTDSIMQTAFRNNLIWLFLYTTFTLALALLIAILADRVKYENLVKAVVFIPMAISFVAAGVIWKLMYDYQPAIRAQTGTVNAFLTTVIPNFEPVAWLINHPINNIALIAIGIWMYTGFATVILSAGLKGIPEELLEAARIDGANEVQIFRNITLPLLSPTIAVVATTMIISVLKIFDIIYVMTNGNFNTEVIANRMYKELFTFQHLGRASAIATLLLLLTAPVMLYNIKRFRQQEELR
jgi:alpha-glucoside transport system permease protein